MLFNTSPFAFRSFKFLIKEFCSKLKIIIFNQTKGDLT